MSDGSLYPLESSNPEPGSEQTAPISLSSEGPVCSRSSSLQEKRMSKATEVMMQYVENLKRTYEKDHAELMEFKKLANQNSSRSCGPSGKKLGSCPLLGPGIWVPNGSRLGSHLWGSPRSCIRATKLIAPFPLLTMLPTGTLQPGDLEPENMNGSQVTPDTVTQSG